jgi:hypothetical protein
MDDGKFKGLVTHDHGDTSSLTTLAGKEWKQKAIVANEWYCAHISIGEHWLWWFVDQW